LLVHLHIAGQHVGRERLGAQSELHRLFGREHADRAATLEISLA
jgi:hypothetical protein